jgi:hypothetical protein
MKQKLVLAWVDRTGFEFTGRYRDRLCQHPETRAVPEARAACWGENTPELLARLKAHVEKEKTDHDWMGYFLLDYNDSILSVARTKALDAGRL